MQNDIWTWDKPLFKNYREILVRQRWYLCCNLHLLSADYVLDSMPMFQINILFNRYTIMVMYYQHESKCHKKIRIQINLTLKHILFHYTMSFYKIFYCYPIRVVPIFPFALFHPTHTPSPTVGPYTIVHVHLSFMHVLD